MNYLAHSYLSFGIENILVGNFIADHIRLPQFEKLDSEVKKGVILHRKIDGFTDSHPLFIQSKRYFCEEFDRYSGILVDIYYDHIFAENFSKYSDVDLNEFTHNVYQTMDNNLQHLPDSSIQFLNYARRNNTFFEYSKIEGIELVLRHLSYRINHGIDLSASVNCFVENKKKIEIEFFEFMEELIDYTKKESLLLI